MRRSLFFRYFLTVALLVSVSFILLGGIFLYQVNRFAAREKIDILKKNLDKVTEQTAQYLALQDFDSSLPYATLSRFFDIYSRSMIQCAAECNGTVIMTEADGNVIFTASEKDGYVQKEGYIPIIIVDSIGINGSYYGLLNISDLTEGSCFVMARSISEDKPIIAVVTMPAGSTLRLYANLSNLFVIMTLGVLTLCLIIAIAVVKTTIKPLKEMASAAQRFGRGDYTARVRVPRQKNELYELAANFNNMADSVENVEKERRELVANVAHDLRTPMTTIAGFVDGMIDGTIKEDKRDYYLQIISDEIKRLSRLASSMLEISKLEADDYVFSMRMFDISEVVRRIVISFEKKLSDKNIDLELDIPDVLNVTANHDAMFQVVYNLIDNALKFVDQNGRISIKLFEKGGSVFFSIENTGSVIPEENLKHVFERFYKGDPSRTDSRNGSGLGLYIVKTIVNGHNGDVSVKSGDNTTEFSFMIPVKSNEAQGDNKQ